MIREYGHNVLNQSVQKGDKGTGGQGDRKFFRLVQTDERGRIKLIYIIYINY